MKTSATALVGLALAALCTGARAGTPLGTTREDFRLPGTQPLTITDPISTPDACATCHSGFGEPIAEPLRNWQGSMMAQAGRDPLMWAALAVANQDAPHAGETCLRCHLPKGWLEGRSAPEDGSAMTAEDRHGVQCGVCHRLVDPEGNPGSPAVDASILAALSAPVPAFGGAMMVVDPLDRLRGPFDVIADLGSDPHAPERSTLVSPFHDGNICGTCHNLRNPAFTRNGVTGEYELNAVDAPNPDPTTGFPEQSTFDEWAASEYATTGVYAPQFGGNLDVVSPCQDCHMPQVTGRDAKLGPVRTNVPRHHFAGANTFIPSVLPFHPAFGSEVDAAVLEDGAALSTAMLRKAATLSATFDGTTLTVRVTNETGHKVPTGYPEGRRLWLHVRALDAQRAVVFESGRYVFSTATLTGYRAAPADPEHDPSLHVWETEMGVSPAVAAAAGVPAGRSFHLALNNVRLKDNRIPPRGFTNAAFAAFDGQPVGATYADGQYWDDVAYPVGAAAVTVEVTLYYQTASREYVEFLRDEDTTTASGGILFDLWQQHNPSTPVEVAKATVDRDPKSADACRSTVAKVQGKYQKRHFKEWSRCFAVEARGLPCDATSRDAAIAAEEGKLRERLGGVKDAVCAGRSLSPSSLGHGTSCPAPCAGIVLFSAADLASCAICQAEALGDATLAAAYGTGPPAVPGTLPAAALACQRALAKAASTLQRGWSAALGRCEQANATGQTQPPADCASDPDGSIAQAKAQAGAQLQQCDTFAGVPGCAASGNAAGVQACLESAVGAVVGPYTEVAYP